PRTDARAHPTRSADARRTADGGRRRTAPHHLSPPAHAPRGSVTGALGRRAAVAVLVRRARRVEALEHIARCAIDTGRGPAGGGLLSGDPAARDEWALR